ncbi:uncharacterized protein LOC121865230 [Homarus americanus]|uniref:uncharacterized protein LOC121865230 n=1 Tax=Homarus americanus TaxID=6706 RepID=UPI001C4556E9|nr:uncharacterized protein LOC121865230 [Homarus americanus]
MTCEVCRWSYMDKVRAHGGDIYWTSGTVGFSCGSTGHTEARVCLPASSRPQRTCHRGAAREVVRQVAEAVSRPSTRRRAAAAVVAAAVVLAARRAGERQNNNNTDSSNRSHHNSVTSHPPTTANNHLRALSTTDSSTSSPSNRRYSSSHDHSVNATLVSPQPMILVDHRRIIDQDGREAETMASLKQDMAIM